MKKAKLWHLLDEANDTLALAAGATEEGTPAWSEISAMNERLTRIIAEHAVGKLSPKDLEQLSPELVDKIHASIVEEAGYSLGHATAVHLANRALRPFIIGRADADA